jgi:sugar phosphate isomerase/epimerase
MMIGFCILRIRNFGKESLAVLVSASTECLGDMPLSQAIDTLIDLEYVNVEVHLDESWNALKPSEVAADLPRAFEACRTLRRMNLIAFSINFLQHDKTSLEHFAACCKLAKATKVVTLTVRCSELGTPFNEEVERLRDLVKIAELEGVRVAVKNEMGRMSEDIDTVCVLCDHAKGLGLTIDPSHFVCGPMANRDYTKLMKYVHHVQLRDSTKEKFQVQVGQGVIDYGKLISQLEAVNYQRALSVHITKQPGIDHFGEMRKMRLLLESMLL